MQRSEPRPVAELFVAKDSCTLLRVLAQEGGLCQRQGRPQVSLCGNAKFNQVGRLIKNKQTSKRSKFEFPPATYQPIAALDFEGAWRRASKHAHHRGQPSVDVQESRPMEGSQRARGASDRDKKEGA